MSKHSPGPWVWRYFKETLVIDDASGENVITFMPLAIKGHAVTDADARLIAAAPELLDALKWAMKILDAQNPCDGCGPSCSNHKARALIERIESDSQSRTDSK